MDERTCKEIAELVSAYRDNDLTPEERAFVQAHLPDCPSCAADLAYYEKLHKGLQQHLASIPVPPLEHTESTLRYRKGMALTAADAARGTRRRISPRFAVVSVTAATVLTLALVGVVYLGRGSEEAQAREILDKAIEVAGNPSAISVRSVELTRKQWIKLSNPPYQSEIKGDVHLWWQTPNLWRIESQQSVSTSGSVTDYFGTFVADGKTIWSSTGTAEGNRVTILPFDSPIDPLGRTMSDVHWFSNFAEPGGDLASLFNNARQCYDPKLLREEKVAGRPAYVIDLGPNKCPTDSASYDLQGRRVIWVDKETFLELKGEQYATEPGQGLISTYEVTSVRYDGEIDPKVFTFTPPPGAVVQDRRPVKPSEDVTPR